MQKKGKRPDIAFLTDRNGTVIARNISPHACPTGHNVGAVMPYVKRALGGEANYAIWSIDDSPFSSTKPHRDYCQLINTGLLEVAAVPVWYADNIAGVLVVGIELSNGAAKEKAEMVDFHLAVVKGGAVYSSSFATDTVRQSLEQQIDKPGIAAKIDSVLRSGVSSETFDIQIGDEPFIAIATPVLSSDKKDKLVNLMMGSVREALEDLDALNLLIAFMAVAILIVIVAGVILGNHFLKPVMAIEEGLLKIINGEYGYRFDINSKEVGGLGYRINQLIGVLTDEEEKEDQR
jgi:methyl-accepting chemotaxis protein